MPKTQHFLSSWHVKQQTWISIKIQWSFNMIFLPFNSGHRDSSIEVQSILDFDSGCQRLNISVSGCIFWKWKWARSRFSFLHCQSMAGIRSVCCTGDQLLLSVADVEERSRPENRQTNNGYQFDIASCVYTSLNSLFLCPNRLVS